MGACQSAEAVSTGGPAKDSGHQSEAGAGAPPAAAKKAPETTTGEQNEVAVNVIHSFGQSITAIRV